MNKKCNDCKYLGSDYEYDEDDEEIEVYSCQSKEADAEDYIHKDIECPYFKKYKPRKYIEKRTVCDKCENLKECIANDNVIETTAILDMTRHYATGLNGCFKKL